MVLFVNLTWGRQIGMTPSLKSRWCWSLRSARSEWVKLLGFTDTCQCFHPVVKFNVKVSSVMWSLDHLCDIDMLSIRFRPLVVCRRVDKHIKVLLPFLHLEVWSNWCQQKKVRMEYNEDKDVNCQCLLAVSSPGNYQLSTCLRLQPNLSPHMQEREEITWKQVDVGLTAPQ